MTTQYCRYCKGNSPYTASPVAFRRPPTFRCISMFQLASSPPCVPPLSLTFKPTFPLPSPTSIPSCVLTPQSPLVGTRLYSSTSLYPVYLLISLFFMSSTPSLYFRRFPCSGTCLYLLELVSTFRNPSLPSATRLFRRNTSVDLQRVPRPIHAQLGMFFVFGSFPFNKTCKHTI